MIVVVTVIGGALLLRSHSFHQYVLAKAEQKASDAFGARVEVKDFALHLSTLSLDLYGLTVYGAAPYANPPLLQVDRLATGVRVVSLLHRSWYLEDIQVEHPVVRVLVDQQGKDNLPQTKSSGGSRTSVFDLAVRHALLNKGELYYNNRKSILNADLHDLAFQSAFDSSQRRYSGTMAYHNGRVDFENFNPLLHDLEAQFSATPTAFTLDRAVLTSGQSRFELTATVDDYNNPRAQATYSAAVDSGELRLIMKNPTLPLGIIRLNGSLQYRSDTNQSVVNAVTLNGDLSSRALQVQTPSFRGEITNIAARYSLAKGNVEVRDIRAGVLGGEMTGTMSMRDIAGASQSKLHAALRDVSLVSVKSLLNSPSLRTLKVDGRVNAIADATWGKTFNNLVAHTEATVRGSLAPAKDSGKAVPIDGEVHARYLAANNEIALSQSYLRTAQTSLTMNGVVSRRSSLQVRLQSNELHELEAVADAVRTPTTGQPAQALGLYGNASFVGAVRGSTSAPEISGQLNATNLRLQGSSWKMLRTNVDVSPSSARLQNGELQPADGGRGTFNLITGLNNWSFTEASPIELSLNASQLNVVDVTKAAGLQYPVTGILSTNVSVHGSELSPVGNGTIHLTQATVYGEPVQSADVNFQGTGNEVHGDAKVRLPAGGAQGTFTYFPKQQGYDVELVAAGIRLDQLQAIKARNLQLTGVLNAKASGRGTFKDPQLTASLQVPKLQIQDQTMDGMTLQANVANHVANLALDSRALNTSIRGRGTVKLSGDYYADVTLDTQSIPLQPLLALYAPSQAANVTGNTELHGTLRGPLMKKEAVDAHITIPNLQMNFKNTVQIGAVSPIQIDYKDGVLTLQRTAIRGTGTDLQLQGRVPMNSSAPASLLALGTIDLKLLELFDPDIASSGQIKFNVNSYGQRADPNVQGQVEIVNANLATGTVPIGLENGNGILTLTKDRLDIRQFHATMGGGEVTARGGVIYKPALQFDLALAGKGVRFLYPDGVRDALSANLTLNGTTDAATLGGKIHIDQLSFTRDFDLANFLGQFSSDTSPPPGQGFAQNLQLNVGVDSSGGVNLVSRALSLQGTANLEVRGTAAQPVILGRINLNSGDLFFMGNRYVLQGGTVDFVNPSETQPVVNVAATTTVQQYNLRLQFQGPVDHLRTNYSSDPALPPSDIINLLAFGKTTEASAAEPTAPGNLGAQAVIASQVSSQVTNRLEKVAGISNLSVDPVLGGGGENPGARVTIQQRVTSNLFVTFGTDVTSTQRQVIQVQYQVSPRVSVSATRDQNGGFGFDTRIRKTW